MRILLIKTSSMGDIIHTLPALTDAMRAIPDIKFDWVIESSFQEIPHWHPAVDRVIPIKLRQWRNQPLSAKTRQEWQAFKKVLAEQQYDMVLDAQGLVKSAFLTRLVKAERVGLNWQSAREPLASLFYQRKLDVNFYQHAVTRMRLILSQALGYSVEGSPVFNLQRQSQTVASTSPYLVFLHGTTWATKEWPEAYWLGLAKLMGQAGFRIKVSGGSDEQVARSMRLAAGCEFVDAMPRLSIAEMATLLSGASAAVAVDTGFGHLAAALDIPIVSIYGATNPLYTGVIGRQTKELAAQFPCSPCLQRECVFKGKSTIQPVCYSTITPFDVKAAIESLGVFKTTLHVPVV